MSFAAVEEKGSAVFAGQLLQALLGIMWLSQRQEPFLVHHRPQQLQNQTLRAHLLFEFLWGWTEDAFGFSINRSLVPQRFSLGLGKRSDDTASLSFNKLHVRLLLPLACRGRRNFSGLVFFHC